MNYSVAERTLEDHEDILAVHRELEMFASQYERRFYFSQDFLKYEVFIKPAVSKKIENFVILQKKNCFFNYTLLKSMCQNFQKMIKFLHSLLLSHQKVNSTQSKRVNLPTEFTT